MLPFLAEKILALFEAKLVTYFMQDPGENCLSLQE